MRCWTLKLFCFLCFDVGIYFELDRYKKQIDDKTGIALKRLTLVGLAVLVVVFSAVVQVYFVSLAVMEKLIVFIVAE